MLPFANTDSTRGLTSVGAPGRYGVCDEFQRVLTDRRRYDD